MLWPTKRRKGKREKISTEKEGVFKRRQCKWKR